ncbi:hypothetical protein N7489_009105 [Penicillium chrysogenum]|uniref:uncharacterized protein n=1 Tax=Penicillium chrysogenum TaxID=5076 RepID=UPI0024DF1A35|nr:uncharacterized protein N7489_009105 [Penicillium chrysogenum]KAJ5228397.1 hypothetical protein N7489_009105 [Penicillium chrysogenum]
MLSSNRIVTASEIRLLNTPTKPRLKYKIEKEETADSSPFAAASSQAPRPIEAATPNSLEKPTQRAQPCAEV